ncbi:MAG: pyridoxal phosphate-dependent decarboxylase family protein [Chloroflexota bacterium]
MKRDALPVDAFIAPDGQNADAVRKTLHRLLDVVIDHMTTATDRPPMPDQAALPELSIADTGTDGDGLGALVDQLFAGAMNPLHPGYIGHMDSMPTTASIVGDLVAAAMNNNMLSIEMSPGLSELETAITAQFAQLFGLPEATSGGVMTGGGTLANLLALTAARNHHLGSFANGLSQRTRQPVILASEVAHTSIRKAAMILGLGTNAVIPVEATPQSRMDPDALRSALHQARINDREPFCVVATAGTTTTGSIDPLPEIAAICAERGLWFHVDAAYGGAAIFSERHAHRLTGIEQADSITFNPQKWLYIAKTCAMTLFRDWPTTRKYVRVDAPYMAAADHVNLGEVSIQGTRRADIIKLWLSLRHIGRSGYAALIDESYRLTTYFNAQADSRPMLRRISPGDTNLVCFRAEPDGMAADALDQHNTGLGDRLLQRQRIFLSLPLYRGNRWLRAVLLNPFTEEDLIDALFYNLDRY